MRFFARFNSLLFVSFLLAGCSLDVSVFGSKLSLPSVGDTGNGPTTVLPMGNYNVVFNKAVGSNAWVSLKQSMFVNSGPLIDSSGNATFIGEDGVYTYSSTGTMLWSVSLPNATYQNWTGERSPMARSTPGDLYIVSRLNLTSPSGLLRIDPAGTIQQIPLSGGNFNYGAYDMTLVTRTNGTEELHMTPLIKDGFGATQPNPVDVYDLNGSYLRSYGGSANVSLAYIAFNPINKKTYALESYSNNIVHIFLENGNLDGIFDLSSTAVKSVAIKFDNNGLMYITTMGNTAGDTDTGVNVYNISSGTPVLVNTLVSSVAHPTYLQGVSVSPTGATIIGHNSINGNGTARDERWQLSGTSYQYEKDLISQGSGVADFNMYRTIGAGGFALDADENIYIDDNRNKRVKVYSKTGALLRYFSVDDASINFWDDHFTAMTTNYKLVTGGYEFTDTVGNKPAKIFIQVRSLTGVQQSAFSVNFTSVPGLPKLIGIDSKNNLWFDDSAQMYQVDLTGAILQTIDYVTNPAALGVSAFYGPQVAGDKIYYTDAGDYSFHARDLDGNVSMLMDSTQYSASGLLAVLPIGGVQPLAGGKFLTFAYDTFGSALFVVVDPVANYSVVSKMTGADQSAFSPLMVWTSAGLITFGSYDRIFYWDIQ